MTTSKILRVLLFLLLPQLAGAQFGLTAGFRFNDAPDWTISDENNVFQHTELLGNGWSAGVDYWFRLKKARLEFLPELNYSRFRNDLNAGWKTQQQWISLYFNTHIYFLDFLGDCDCPTFSKQGQVLKKGIFLQLSPGITWMQNELKSPASSETADDIAFSIGAGIGLDIGLSNLMTLSPTLGVRFFPSAAWEDLSMPSEGLEKMTYETSITQGFAGIRLGWRLDHRRY